MALEVDHLVVAARTLEEGAAWCEATLGAAPVAGGRHALMGTHNRLLAIAAPGFPRAYLEIIALDPDAPPPGRRRWFDLDDAAVRAAIADAPVLLHWVARCGDIDAASASLAALGIDAGRVLEAARGTLAWRIAVRDDGRRPLGGALPALIEWRGDAHPADTLSPSGVALRALTLGHSLGDSPGAPLAAALHALGAGPGLRLESGAPPLAAEFDTPRGRVALRGLAPA